MTRPKSPSLFVVLATCNGEQHLSAQLQSLEQQSRTADRILVSDDCSDDSTLKILHEWANLHPERIAILPQPSHRLGSQKNFARLLEAAHGEGAGLLALCDQDDVWDKDKLLVLEAALSGVTGPAMAVSDLAVVDKSLSMIDSSYWHYKRFSVPMCANVCRIAVMNVFPGCAMLINRDLLSKAVPLPQTACMHDWWLAILASAVGRIILVERPLVLYRQHGGNVLGAGGGALIQVWKRGLSRHGSALALSLASHQALAALNRLEHVDSPVAIKALRAVAESHRVNWWRRRLLLARAGVGKCGFLRNMWFYSSV